MISIIASYMNSGEILYEYVTNTIMLVLNTELYRLSIQKKKLYL